MTDPVEATRSEKRWAMLAHALTLAGWVIPLADLLAPALVGWICRGSAYAKLHVRSSMRFQVSCCLIYKLVGLGAMGICYVMFDSQLQGNGAGIWVFVLAMVSLAMLGLMWVIAAIGLVLHASIRAHAGVPYRYLFTLRFLR